MLKVVGYYDLSVLSMSVMGFQKRSLDAGWVGGASSIQVLFDFWNFFNFTKPLNEKQQTEENLTASVVIVHPL